MNDRGRDRESFFINSHGPDKPAIERGLKWLFNICMGKTCEGRGLVAVPQKSNISEGVVSEVLGEKVSKVLAKDDKVFMPIGPPGFELHLMTKRKEVRNWEGPVLAIYPDEDLLNKLDAVNGVTEVLVIPWLKEEAEDWIETWSAKELDDTSRADESSRETKPAISNPVVEEALRSLTIVVNVSTGISHPYDRGRTIDMFEKLKEAGEPYDLKEVRNWLIRKGWEPRHADDVVEIGKKVLEGKRPRKERSWKADIVDDWRKSAKSKQR